MHTLLTSLVARRLWIYGGGLAVVLLVRSTLADSTLRSLFVAVVVAVMVVTYAGEVWLDADTESVGRLAVGCGAVGVAVGVFLTVGGDLWGLLFLAGGLLFLNRGLGGSRDGVPTAGDGRDPAGGDRR
jgi:hypothetical protein